MGKNDSFVRRRLPKPAHVEKITLHGHVISCACGEPWFAATEAVNGEARCLLQPLAGQSCPTCGAPPTRTTTSAREEMKVDVPLQFGQLQLPAERQRTAGEALVLDPNKMRGR
jgi:hypothetical protein